jgi:DNA-binding response OmpR family regulator
VGMKILLADDSVTAQNMGKKILSEAGHEVVTVSNGAAAAKKIAEIKPELVLLDVFMPGYSGLELCERLRNAAETSKLPVLLTVGRMEPYSPNDGTRVKADGVIVKPFEASDLTAAVDRLAEKIRPAKQLDPRAMKIVPRQDSQVGNAPAPQDERNSSGAIDAAKAIAHSAELPYEKTQRLDRSHVEAVLSGSAASKPEDTAPLMVTPEQEFDMSGPAHSADVQVESTDQDSQAEQSYLSKPRAESGLKEPERRFAVPSYMTQYLADHPEFNGDAASESKPASNVSMEVAKPPVEEAKPTSDINNDLMHHSQSDGTLNPPVGSATGLVLTAAAPVPDQPVAIAPGFEPTLQTSEQPPTIAKDPALVTDLHHASMDFPTRFGAGEPELADFLVEASQEPEKPAPSSTDEFEARLSAALSSYEQPSADLPLVAPPETDTPTAEIPRYDAPEPDSITDAFEAQIAAAMHGSEIPAAEHPFEVEPNFQLSPELGVIGIEAQADIVSDFASEPDPFASQRTASNIIPQEDETSSIKVISDTLTGSGEAERVALGLDASPAPEPDDVVIEQMRSSLSHLPVDPIYTTHNSHPLAMAAAAGAAPGGSLTTSNPDPEVARAIAAALVQEALTDGQSSEIAEPVAAPASDANHLAGAVEKVMKQELPSLVWKIMAELDLRKGR